MSNNNESIGTATSVNGTEQPHDQAETIPVFARRFGSWHVSVQRRPFSALELEYLYDRAAPAWDRTLARLRVPRAYEPLLRKVFDEHTVRTDGVQPRVLDCGVGTGALSVALANVLPMRCSLDAVDVSPRMLELAQRQLRNADIDVRLREGDVRKLPYPDNAFDVAMTAHVLEHLADPRTALNEMTRVLKPGGLTITCMTRRSAFGKLIQFKWRTHQATPALAQHWLRDSGLEDVRCLSVGDGPISRQLSVACIGRKANTARPVKAE